MKCVIVIVFMCSIVSILDAAEPTENDLVAKVQCVANTMDAIVSEFQCDSLWQENQEKIVKNINNLFLCLKSTGFQLQR